MFKKIGMQKLDVRSYVTQQFYSHDVFYLNASALRIYQLHNKTPQLILKDPFISESCIEIRIELNFYFHTSLWCLKRFYEDLKGLHKTF